jgi:hypothetical protein
MRKVLLTLTAAGMAFGLAAPAAAQFYPGQRPYGYGQGNWGPARSLQVRIDNVQRQIRMLDRRNVIRDDRADRLRAEANQIERQLYRHGRNGLNPYEANEINARIARLEQRVQFAVANRGRYGAYGYNGGYRDRDRDGRNDRYEDDRGYHHDD